MLRLGSMYENGQGVAKDMAQAVAWYCKIAEGGDARVMNHLGWAFTALLFSDPSVRWLVLSPAREAPGWAFVGWLMQRTGSVQLHMGEQPGPFGE